MTPAERKRIRRAWGLIQAQIDGLSARMQDYDCSATMHSYLSGLLYGNMTAQSILEKETPWKKAVKGMRR